MTPLHELNADVKPYFDKERILLIANAETYEDPETVKIDYHTCVKEIEEVSLPNE